ncbi:hypothetical protein A4H97_10360 [Niastella yeongjuensis]|uniref:Secretion system C-terminal sorting domain-containing protein n=2 Tax=Niastella yeongjuensis TaxID=354355 RepID=A0A1V9EFQ3_9BACT|nr:hypothetical protein A4H97_10360 [Niastella yeongjuensis]
MSLSHLESFSQCGTAPTSGLTTISSADIVVNSYYAGRADANSGSKTVPVNAKDNRSAAAGLASGDMVLIIQMQGAQFTTTNSSRYGDNNNGDPGSGYTNNASLVAGYYEYNLVASYNGTNSITLTYPLLRTYNTSAYTTTQGIETFQVIRVPRDYDLNIASGGSITAPAWNGSTGGVVVLNVNNTLTINGAIAVDGKGFRGGGGKYFKGTTNGSSTNNATGGGQVDLENTDYRFNSTVTNNRNTTGGAKGEGIAGTPAFVLPMGATNATTNTVEGYIGGSMGRGAPGNAGGGGTDGDPTSNQYNPGGGGGANGGDGGMGGSGWDGGDHDKTNYPYGGFGGKAFAQRSKDRFVMGGGGGAGTGNNSTAGSTDYISSGGCGGGIVLIRAKFFSGSGTISANGAAALDQNVTGITDAAGGGGAGGSIIVLANDPKIVGTHTIKASANGGKGGDMSAYFAHGPGGGGGGGYVLTNIIPTGSITVTGAASGRTRATATGDPVNDPYGSTAGSDGVKSVVTGGSALTNTGSPATPCGTLPVTLTQWSGIYKNNKTYLSWTVENVADFSHFSVERSADGAHFSPLGDVAGITSGAFAQSYSFEDVFPADGVNYYRLKMIDLNGQYTYSGVLIIRTNGSGIQINATPNPFTDHVVISIQSTTDEPANLRVFNSDGKLVWRKTTYVKAGTNVQYFNDLQSLPKGVYIIKVDKGDTTGEFRMLKQ